MTTIICIQKDDGVQFGADAQVTANNKVYVHDKMAKITQRGQFIIAGAGEVAACDIAQHIWEPPIPTAHDKKDLYHFIIAKVIPSLKSSFKDNDYKIDGDSDGETRFAFLIAIGGHVFEIADDFSVALDKSGFYGIGSGSSFALGALHAGATPAMAMKIAAENDAYTSAPFMWKSQKK
jgi:ATP-dependent protease HslVU (ClpYQ) peptidase subunit